MQLDWNDLRLLAMLRRGRTLRGTAELMKIDATTVSRRLRQAETAQGAPLTVRDATGQIVLTEEGSRLADLGEQVGAALEGQPVPARVRLSAVPFLVHRVLAPALPLLPKAIALELFSEPGNVDLGRRTADIALRLARPEKGGHRVLIRKLTTLRFVAAAVPEAKDLSWIGYEPGMRHLPHAAWIDEQEHIGPRVTDLDAAMAAARAGVGPTLVPLQWVTAPLVPMSKTPVVSRDIWLVNFRGTADRPAIKAVARWAEKAVTEAFSDR